MSVAYLNTAKSLRKPDNGLATDILTSSRKVVPFPASDSRLNSEFVYKTVPLGVGCAGACVRTMTHKPIRKIVARFPEMWEVQPGYSLTIYRDTLACSHQVITYGFEAGKNTRGCEECLAESSLLGKKAA